MKKLAIFIFGLLIALAGCQESNVTPTSGTTIVEVDSAIAPIISKERNAFDSLYVKAKVELKIVSPVNGMVDLLNKKVKVFISPRYFNKQELDFANKEKLNVKTFKFCYNAVVVVSSKQNNLTQIRVDELRDALLGKTSKYEIVIPQSTTTTYQYLKDNVLEGKTPKGVDIVPTEKDVLSRIQKSNNLIGITSFNLVQDSSKIKFIKLGELNQTADSSKPKSIEVNYFTPHPGFVLKNYYPFRQTVYIFLSELEMSPASGFTTFLTSYEGQKIALTNNLAPAAVPVKINEFQ